MMSPTSKTAKTATAAEAAAAAPRTVTGRSVAPSKLAHVVLRTRRFDESLQWWTQLLAGQVVFSNGFLGFITYDEEHHRVALIDVGPAADGPGSGTGLDHVAFTYATLGDLLETYARLREAGIVPHWCINHGPTTSLYYRDPDGLQAELQIDNFPTLEALAEWFASGAFLANPIGVELDPERLLARYEAGDPVEDLVKQGSA